MQLGVVDLGRMGGNIVRRLVDLGLTRYAGNVEDSGEGRWTVHAAVEEAVPAEVGSAALYARFRSREQADFADKILSAMRNKFGGHLERAAAP